MYIVGHTVITDQSQLPKCDPFSLSGIALMLPDYVRCHDWGYDRCFSKQPETEAGRLIRSHMLADWFVHYGDGPQREKKGWAYRNMTVYAKAYDDFRGEAARRKLRENVEMTDSRRGFCHTMVEYSIDTWLSDLGLVDSKFSFLVHTYGQLGEESGIGSAGSVRRMIEQEGIELINENLEQDIHSFGRRVRESKSPIEFAYRAGVKKFGLEDSDESVALMAEFISNGLKRLDHLELERFLTDCVSFLRHWMLDESRGEFAKWN